MKYVLVTVSGGIIYEVTFYDERLMAIRKLSEYVKVMNPEHNDAAVYGLNGMIANDKAFLDEDDQYIERSAEDMVISDESDESIFIIGNPLHRLGFMVASYDDPLAYNDPAEAISELGQMRRDSGSHLKLYRVEPVNGPVAHKKDLDQYIKDCEIDDFDYCLVKEYLTDGGE